MMPPDRNLMKDSFYVAQCMAKCNWNLVKTIPKTEFMDLGGIDPEDPDAAGLTKEEQAVVLSVHLMALMLDGAP